MSFLSRRHSQSAEVPVVPVTAHYRLETDSTGLFRIVDERLGTVDIVRGYCVADYNVRHLNAGTANVNPHAIVGCRVELC